MEKKGSYTKTLEISTTKLGKGALFAGRYEVQEELGKGGMGRVYKVLDREIGETVALKILNPEIAAERKTIERFRNELKVARKITHRNVCRMHDINKEKTTYFITMEYVPGEDLKSLIRRKERLTEDEAILVAEQVCAGLGEAHRLGVTHRDLKPQNIMIDEEGKARIMDFGIARSRETRGMTEEGLIIGTPDYMSPEQVEGGEAEPRSDVYSLGVVLYEMVTGRVPFEGKTALSIAFKHKTEAPLDPRKINDRLSDEFSSVILKCLEKEKEKRYQTAEELLADLQTLREGFATPLFPGKFGLPGFLVETEAEAPAKRPVFVAREHELSRLGKWLDSSIAGKGQVVLVTGEAGSGKTALLQEFSHRAQEANSDLIVAAGKCNAHTGIGDPYFPFIEIMGLLTGDVEAKWAAGVISRDNALRLWNLLPLSARALLDGGQDLINIFVPGGSFVSRSELAAKGPADWLTALKKIVERKSSLPADSTLQQSTLFEQYTRLLLALAKQKPLLLILDDLQWVDAGSTGLLFHLGRRLSGSRILILGAFRPSEITIGRGGERHPMEPIRNEFKSAFGDVEIEVGKAEERRFVDNFIDSEPNRLDEKFRRKLHHQTKGHPLFTVELLRTMQERGALIKDEEGRWVEGPEFEWDTLPARIDAVIEERVNRLNEKLRETLTIASVEGEEFTAEVIARLQDAEIFALIRILSRELEKRHHLVSAKGIRQLAKQRLSLYLFQHILFQRYLYSSLDAVERAHLHEQVGKILESLYGDETEEISVQLARHFLEAGNAPKAIEYLQKAGQRAVKLSANEEAIAHYRKALDLLLKLPETPERDQQELALQLALFVPESAAKGFGAPGASRAVLRVRELCEKIGESPQLFTALVQLAFYYAFARADYRKTLELQERIVRIAEQTGDPLQRAISSYVTTWPLLNVGELTKTLEHAQQMNAVYDPVKHSFLAHIFSFDLGIMNRGFASFALWFMGYPDQARQEYKTALEHARQLGHPFTLAFALVGGCELHWFLREPEKIVPLLKELAAVSEEKGLVYWQAHAIFYKGEKLISVGKIQEGLVEMRRGLNIMLAAGTLTCFTRLLARMADACLKVGEFEAGLAAVNEADKVKCKFDERYMEAEIYRLKGELLLKKGEDPGAVMKQFEQALEVSRAQKAKTLELRAAMSMGRLLQKQGKA
ncbi:MAG TPA: protein kinase, partial [Candidatus Desulfaltia sp.]|nr:protein kinase [Candidatus Desulfaltia sp.]